MIALAFDLGHTESAMPTRDTDLNIDRVNLSDLDERTAFYRAWAAKGAARTRAERQQAVQDGILDKDGSILRPVDLASVDERVTVEQ